MAKCGSGNQVVATGNKLPAGARVFVLSGASQKGKSTTLNKLASHMAFQVGLPRTVGPNPPSQGTNRHRDAQYVFVDNQNGIKIGISTAGDDAKQIKNGFSHFRKHGCDVCFIASKTSGDSIRQIERECHNILIPQYQFLPCEYGKGKRTRNQVQSDVVAQLYGMI